MLRVKEEMRIEQKIKLRQMKMASAADMPSDSLDVVVTEVPESLQEYVKTKVAEYLVQAKDVSMNIHCSHGGTSRLEMTFGTNTPANTSTLDTPNKPGSEGAKTILVQNVPDSVTEDLLEIFFESKKKYGGGPVKSVKLLNGNKVAIVEFCDASAVDEVLKKKPIVYGTTELDVKPCPSLLSGDTSITTADIKGLVLPRDFTEELLKKHVECIGTPIALPPYGPDLTAMMTPGTRVVRGRDWDLGNEDGGGEGTVLIRPFGATNEFVHVQWDNGKRACYAMGYCGKYSLTLAPK